MLAHQYLAKRLFVLLAQSFSVQATMLLISEMDDTEFNMELDVEDTEDTEDTEDMESTEDMEDTENTEDMESTEDIEDTKSTEDTEALDPPSIPDNTSSRADWDHAEIIHMLEFLQMHKSEIRAGGTFKPATHTTLVPWGDQDLLRQLNIVLKNGGQYVLSISSSH